jgi:GR25 family glycosyltransferase involved in LPS biosynthesis
MECQKYVIHLEERTDRYELMKEDLFVQYPECNIFNALKDPEDGCRALSKGFRNLFMESLRTGEDMILTFEDDVKFTSPQSRKRFEEVYQTLPDDWDIFLGGIYIWEKPQILNDTLAKCRDFSGLHMALWRNTSFQKMLEHQPENGIKPADIDRFISRTDLNVYICYPMVAVQHQTPSNIARVSRDLDSILGDKMIFT